MPSGNKPLPEPVLTKISNAIWRPRPQCVNSGAWLSDNILYIFCGMHPSISCNNYDNRNEITHPCSTLTRNWSSGMDKWLHLRSPYLQNGISHTGKTTSLYIKVFQYIVCSRSTPNIDVCWALNWRLHFLCYVNGMTHRLRLSHSLLSFGLSVAHGAWTLNWLASVSLLWSTGLNVYWGNLPFRCFVGGDRWEFPPFFKGHGQSPCTALTAWNACR